MQVVGYVRVSTEDQAKEGISLAAQQAKIDAYTVVKDWALVEVIRDEGQSAKDINRPGLQRVLRLVESRAVAAVIVYKLDRLTRSVADLDKLMKLFERRSVALVSLQESLDATTATGRLMMNLLASVSQWEREVIGERTKDALQHLKAQGLRYCKALYEDEAVVAMMHAWRAAGLSYRAVADELNRAGTPPTVGGSVVSERRAAHPAKDRHDARKECGLMAEDRLLTPEDVAERLAISPLTAVRWMRSGKLPGAKLGEKIWRMKDSALQAFIAGQPTPSRFFFIPLGTKKEGREAFPLAQINEVLRDHGWVMNSPTGEPAHRGTCCPLCDGSLEGFGVFECRRVTRGEGGD